MGEGRNCLEEFPDTKTKELCVLRRRKINFRREVHREGKVLCSPWQVHRSFASLRMTEIKDALVLRSLLVRMRRAQNRAFVEVLAEYLHADG